MRALIITSPSDTGDTTEVREIPTPQPGRGEVTIDVEFAGINFIDVMARRGDVGYVFTWPFVPGLEVAGIVRDLGKGVQHISTGDRVAAFTGGGGLAEVAVARASLVAPVPDRVAAAVAAAAPLMLSSALMLLTDVGRVRPGERLLMHSASGGIGSAVAKLAALVGSGLRVGTVGRPDKIADAERIGWDVALARTAPLLPSLRSASPQGFDVILDPSGTDHLDIDLELVAPGGRIILFGNAAGVHPRPLPTLPTLIRGNAGIIGFSISGLAATAPHRVSSALSRVLELLAGDLFEFPVSHVQSLEAVPFTHQLLAEGRGVGKYVARVHEV
jgi:NADPH2:quinone reductase